LTDLCYYAVLCTHQTNVELYIKFISLVTIFDHTSVLLSPSTMPGRPVISYLEVTRVVTEEFIFRRKSPDPYVRNNNIRSFLRNPTWAVRSLLPNPYLDEKPAATITPQQLHHLLRLSALPLPEDAEEETSMLQTLETHLHFVRQIQKVDTTGVEPLVSICDETPDAREENTIRLADLRAELAAEEKSPNFNRRRRVPREDPEARKAESWDLARMAEGKMMGKFFVVRRQMEEKTEQKPEQKTEQMPEQKPEAIEEQSTH
jgi:aspartyl/glutamyl-tRNA(Asn/Gln) amidotransferase C subunit